MGKDTVMLTEVPLIMPNHHSPSDAEGRKRDWSWPLWPVLPLYPYGQRRTLRREVVKDTIWIFDQPHGWLYAIVPIRMTVIRLRSGGLLVYAPVAPTPECVQLVQELEAEHGAVRVILLPTSSGLEHKVFVGPFARQFPQAQVWVAPHQWSFPLDLPLHWLGFPAHRTRILPASSAQTPLADEIDYAVLDIDLGRGSFAEVAVLHQPSGTVLFTDSLVSLSPEPPEILQQDPYPLLFHARESARDQVEYSWENACKGWQRICLFALYFRPAPVEPISFGQTLREALQASDRSKKGYFGLLPFRWQEGWQESFAAIYQDGHPFVAPILQTLIFPQDPPQVRAWVEKISSWEFEQIIPCHFSAPVAATPDQVRDAFQFLWPPGEVEGATSTPFIGQEDMNFIKQLEDFLIRYKIAKPPPQP